MAKKIMFGEGWEFTSNGDEPAIDEILSKKEHNLKIRKEKRKKGKVVTLIGPFYLEEKELKQLAKSLKQACGVGGSLDKNYIALQGDVEPKAKEALKKQGF